MGAAEWAMLIALATVWGGSFPLNEIALTGVPVLSVAALRVGLAALVLWAVLIARGGGLPRRAWGACLVMGVVNNVVPFTLIVWGQLHVTAGTAAILNATTPFFAAIIAHFATDDERITPRRLGGIAIGIAGVAAMVGAAAVRDLGAAVVGQIAVLGAAASYGVAGVYGRRFGRAGVAPLAVAAGQTTASGLILVPLALAVDGLPAPAPGPLAAVATLAVVCTALAYVLYFRILATSGAVNLLLVTLLVPVGAILLGALFLGETLGLRHAVGMAAIAVGLLMVSGRPRRARDQASST